MKEDEDNIRLDEDYGQDDIDRTNTIDLDISRRDTVNNLDDNIINIQNPNAERPVQVEKPKKTLEDRIRKVKEENEGISDENAAIMAEYGIDDSVATYTLEVIDLNKKAPASDNALFNDIKTKMNQVVAAATANTGYVKQGVAAANKALFDSIAAYMKGRKSVRSSEAEREQFDYALSVLCFMSKNASGLKDKINAVVDRINTVRKAENKFHKDHVDLDNYDPAVFTPGQRLTNEYSNYEIDSLTTIGGKVLYGILDARKSEAKKKDLLKGVSTYRTFFAAGNPNEADILLGDDYPEAVDVLRKGQTGVDTRPRKTIYLSGIRNSNEYLTPEFEKMLRNTVKGMKSIHKELDDYSKSAEFTPAQKSYVEMFKQATGDLAYNRGLQKKMINNPVYNVAINTALVELPVKTAIVKGEVDENGRVTYDVTKINNDANWRDVINAVEKTPMLDFLVTSVKTQQVLDKYNENADATVQDIIDAYKNYKTAADKWYGMSREYFDENVKPHVQDGYDDIIIGRNGKSAYYDAEAKIELLEKGYPVSDLSAFCQFYSLMKIAEADGEKSKDIYDMMHNTWTEIMSRQPLTSEVRTQNLEAMDECVGELQALARENGLEGSVFKTMFGGNTLKILETIVKDGMKKPLSAIDKLRLDGSFKDMFDALDSPTTDPGNVKSSPEYKKMKEAIQKLSLVNKEENPEKYKLLKKDAIQATKAYIGYKDNQMHKPGSTHTRSKLEFTRVTTSKAILDRLVAIDKRDQLDKNLQDDKEIKEAVELTEKQRQLVDIIRRKNPKLVARFQPNKKLDYYAASRKNKSVSEMAKDYMAIKMLNKIYKSNNKDYLTGIDFELDSYDYDVNHLSKSPVFKSMVEKYPDSCYSKWAKVEKRVNELQSDFHNKEVSMISRGGNISEDQYLALLPPEHVNSQAGKLMTYKILKSPIGQTIVESMAVDPVANQIVNEIVDDLAKEAKRFIESKIKGNVKVGDIVNSEQMQKNCYKQMLASYNRKEVDKKNQPDRQNNINKGSAKVVKK